MTITQAICTKNARYRANEPLTPTGVVLHSIGTPQPDARVLQGIWQRKESPYVTHYVLDDVRVLQTMPHNRKCWHVGAPGNGRWLGIELCEPKEIRYTGGASFRVLDRAAARAYCEKTYENAVQLLAKLCRDYGWDPDTAILTHYEVTRRHLSQTDHVDPEHLWTGLGLPYSLTTLRAAVKAAMGGGSETAPAVSEATPQLRRVTASVLNVRSGPGTDYAVTTTVRRGGVYTITAERDGWGRLKSGAGWVSLRYLEPLS